MGWPDRYARHNGEKRPRRFLRRKLMPVPLIMIAMGMVGLVADGSASFRAHLISQPEIGPATGQTIVGRANVIDGDTIEIRGERIRFNGVDAPESAQSCGGANGRTYACGRVAAKALDEFLAASQPVTCHFVEWDRYDRYVGNCVRADGYSVQEWLVSSGNALDWPRYSHGAFATQQMEAQKARRGVWQGKFQKPWEWRAAQRVAPPAPAAVKSPRFTFLGTDCSIKGNISAKGERIYHVPGQEHYDRSRIEEGKGERWFCSETEAMDAGWRKAKR